MTATDDLNTLPTLTDFAAFVTAEHDGVCEERKLSLVNAINQWIANKEALMVGAFNSVSFDVVCDCESDISTSLSGKGYTATCVDGRITITL
jgi:hypothetical protein